jgi:succinyl-diaminopimelate desuccinylase
MNAAPVESIVELASRLVATPSCAGIDAPDAVLEVARRWLAENGLRPRLLRDGEGRPVAVLVEIDGREPGPVLCLDACIDSAPAGDPEQWTEPPFAGAVQGRRLLGRGAADSKAARSICCSMPMSIPAGSAAYAPIWRPCRACPTAHRWAIRATIAS